MIVTTPVWGDVLAHLRDLAISYALALPVGWDREQSVRSAGVRTFPLVAMANCAVVLIATSFGGTTPEVQARVLQGLITGTGFLAAGVVLKDSSTDAADGSRGVRGMTTAVSIWAIGIVGAAVGFGLYDIAVVLAIAMFATLRALAPVKRAIARERSGER